ADEAAHFFTAIRSTASYGDAEELGSQQSHPAERFRRMPTTTSLQNQMKRSWGRWTKISLSRVSPETYSCWGRHPGVFVEWNRDGCASKKRSTPRHRFPSSVARPPTVPLNSLKRSPTYANRSCSRTTPSIG